MGRPLAIRVLQLFIVGTVCAASGVTLLTQNPPPAAAATSEQGQHLVWPESPAAPTIRFLYAVPAPEGSGEHPTALLRRLGKALFSKSAEPIVRPLGVAARNGFLYVADPGGHALLIAGLERGPFQRITKAGSDLLVSPVGVAAGKNRVFVSDSSLKRICVYDRRGKFVKTFGGDGLERPTGLAFDEASEWLYVTDTAAHRIRIYGQNGQLVRAFGRRGTADGQFNYPTHVWLDSEERLFVVDSLNYRVQIFRSDGTFVAAFGRHGDGSGDFASPKGIATDSAGHVYVVDALFDTVQIFDRRGRLLLSFGEQGSGPGRFWLPSGIFVDERDRIYVADSYNQRIQVFEFLGRSDADEERDAGSGRDARSLP